jgi:glutamyl-tRNA synthetase
MLLGKDRSKLSKRHGATSLLDYAKQGYLPEAMFNFLGLLGWSLDDHTEIITREQFTQHFSLERIVKSPAIFDLDKLTWMNGVYMRDLPRETLVALVRERLERDLPPDVPRPLDEEYILRMVPLIRERVKRLDDLKRFAEFFFLGDDLDYSLSDLLGKAFAGRNREAALALGAARERLASLPSWDAQSLEEALRPLAEELSLKAGDLFMLVRVAITGSAVAPPLFQSMAILGRERCLARLGRAIEGLGGNKEGP